MSSGTDSLTDEGLIVACCPDPERQLVNGEDDPTLIVKYGDNAVVKFGEVPESEARNQRLAHRILDPKIVRVPAVYHYFSRDSVDYLVMEYIEGEPCDNEARPETIERIAAVVNQLASHHGDTPGPREVRLLEDCSLRKSTSKFKISKI
jgi:aminoglycoside phosphotransferase